MNEFKDLLQYLDQMDVAQMNQELQPHLMEPPFSDIKEDTKEVTQVFVTLHGYERLTQQKDAHYRTELLHDYFGVIVETIFEHQGSVDAYIGLTIAAMFNAPLSVKDPALLAIKAALSMRDRLPTINHQWFPTEQVPLEIGIGIHTEQLVCPQRGFPQPMEFVVAEGEVKVANYLNAQAQRYLWQNNQLTSHAITVADYLSRQARRYGCDILIGQRTYQSCAECLQVQERDVIQLTQEGETLTIYELIGLLDTD